ncbi:hypothetical protein [Massilia sp. DD77]|uniref:hypothetical protein n=1 Tax=Massilia sp. DD77 TaxID=3109349 RepID=UPI002FFE2F9F
MYNAGRKIAGGIGRAAWSLVRLVLYVLLLLLGRVVLPIASLATTVGIVVFLFCLMFRPDLPIAMWAGGGLAVGAGATSAFYEAALRAVAPTDVVIVSDV